MGLVWFINQLAIPVSFVFSSSNMSRRPAPTLSADEAANKQIKIQVSLFN